LITRDAFRQGDHAVQPDRLGRNRAAYPRQRRCLAARVELEHLNRLSIAVMDDVQRVDGIATRPKKQAVRPELVLLFGIDRARARVVGLRIEPLP
jgi:hypothetical protein